MQAVENATNPARAMRRRIDFMIDSIRMWTNPCTCSDTRARRWITTQRENVAYQSRAKILAGKQCPAGVTMVKSGSG